MEAYAALVFVQPGPVAMQINEIPVDLKTIKWICQCKGKKKDEEATAVTVANVPQYKKMRNDNPILEMERFDPFAHALTIARTQS